MGFVVVCKFEIDSEGSAAAERGTDGEESAGVAADFGGVGVALVFVLALRVFSWVGRFGRGIVAHPFVGIDTVVDLCGDGMLRREAEIDLDDYDVGVVDDVSAHALLVGQLSLVSFYDRRFMCLRSSKDDFHAPPLTWPPP